MDWFTSIIGFGKGKKIRLAMNEWFNYILRSESEIQKVGLPHIVYKLFFIYKK
jgi:hypothetical protein